MAADAKRSGVRTWLLNLAAENAGGAVYGTVMIGVLFATEDGRREGYAETLAAAAIIVAVYWLLHFYAYALGERLRTRDSLSRAVVWRSALHELPVLEGAFVPVVALLGAWIAGAKVTTGVAAAAWTAAITVVGLELVAGWRSGLPLRGLCLQTAIGILIAVAIIALKLVLH